jgi:predicted amidohydrolase YtcJ
MTADLIVLAQARTMDHHRPRAGGVAIVGGRIVAVGDADELRAVRGPRTEVREVEGGHLLPGFHDAHVHLAAHGLALGTIDLAAAATLDEALELVARRAADLSEGSWILGAGFALTRWGVRSLHRADLDRVAPHHPVHLRSQDHHAGWSNSAALAAAGITSATPDPEHGVIVRDEAGEPTGYLLERAERLVGAAVPAPGRAALSDALTAAGRDLARRGITTVHHMAYEPAAHWRAIADAASGADYPLRVWSCIPHADIEHAAALGLAQGQGGDGFVVGGAKFFADGALGSRTAWMLEPYAGEEGRGMAVDGPEVLAARLRLAAEAGFAGVIHAIGDAAVRAALDALEATEDAWRPLGLRPRIEHVQHVHDDDIPRFARLGVTASMQPIHLTFDAPSIRAALPDRVARAYRMRDLRDAGAVLAFGSDTTVAPPDVLAGLRAAVRRLDAAGVALAPEQALDVDEALEGWTRGAATAIGREARSGVLRPGADADLVVLSADPARASGDDDELRVVLTVQGGRVTFDEA